MLREFLNHWNPKVETMPGMRQAGALPYSMVDGRVVYRPVRKWMPPLEGLTAESVSLRRNRLTLKYSFR